MFKNKKSYFPLFLLIAGASSIYLTLSEAQAQNRDFHEDKISCNSSWGTGVHNFVLATVADPASIQSSLTDVPLEANCESWEFRKTPGKSEWKSSGAYCLTIGVVSGNAAQRELELVGDPSAPKIKFNFTYAGNTSPGDAVGNGFTNGFGVPYHGISPGANNVANGPPLSIDTGKNNDLGIYLHPASQQPQNLQAGTYEGTFTWYLYAGTANSMTYWPSSTPKPFGCAQKTGKLKQTGQIKITMKVNTSCKLDIPAVGTILQFGQATSSEINAGLGPATQKLNIKCNSNQDTFVTIGAGLHSGGGGVNNRHMKLKTPAGNDLIKYDLIKPGGGIWGDAPNSSSGYLVPKPSSPGATQIVPIEGRIPPQPGTFAGGLYEDTVQIQLWN